LSGRLAATLSSIGGPPAGFLGGMKMDHTLAGKRLLAQLGIEPVYVVSSTDNFRRLSEAEHQLVFGDSGTIAFTSAAADLLFKSSYLRYDWQGRGCCIVFCQSPLFFTETETLGLMLHEAGHYVADYDRPERDDTDHGRALKAFWGSMQQSGEHHDAQWLRATIHLWHRACKLGYEIPLSNVVNLEQYGFERKHLLPLLDEAERREGEEIESILASGSQPTSAPVVSQAANRGLADTPRSVSIMQGAAGPATTEGAVAVIPVVGLLSDEGGGPSSYQTIAREFDRAIDNSNVKGVLLYFDTPGGSAIGAKRVADIFFDARGLKPIRAYVQGICGSAGYYLAAATDRIEVTADSLVGSIGTIFPHQEFSGMLKELGIGATIFTNAESPKKGHGNLYEPLSDDAKETLQQFVDSYGRPFIASR
jgi:hypothetical protein